MKILYSYGGKIIPRRSDGKLRYVGGHTRVLSVDRSIRFSELMAKFEESCGSSVRLKFKLPSEDLDVLVSITCDEDLVSMIDEYDRFSSSTHKDVKIRAVLFSLKPLKKISPVSSAEDLCSTDSSVDYSPSASPSYAAAGFCSPKPSAATAPCRCGGRNSPSTFVIPVQKDASKVWYHPGFQQGSRPVHIYRCYEQGSTRHMKVVPHWNHCQ
ncbi:hypothetical protein NMG60_11002950 [Bertholletia excelsa]